ncbi:DNA replication/repair protein RecF [Candidatus Sumerlaeota bacterium]|nr:DNA replication/repair protein RecF [Candidatus Sumerlaeota bacterium]
MSDFKQVVFMRLLEVSLENFRNIKSMYIEPAPGVNLFWGENAQGKTNLLEAIYYLVTGRSFRTRYDREALPWDAPADTTSIIRGRVQNPETQYNIIVAIDQNRKEVSCNEKALSSLGLLWGKMNAVLFTPGDLEIIQGTPSARRRFLDMEGSQMNTRYLHHLQSFNQILKQRNALLKSDIEEENLAENLEVWDEQISEHAAEIYYFRKMFLERLTRVSQEIFNNLGDTGESLDLVYDNFLGQKNNGVIDKLTIAAIYKKDLKRLHSEDLYRGSTTCGPHRDDFIIRINGREARTYASQGQTRSLAIALRLAEIRLMEEYTGHAPLLLLDDIVSELDEARRRHFLSLLKPGYQTFITGTDADTVAGSLPVEKSFHIKGGEIVLENIDI